MGDHAAKTDLLDGPARVGRTLGSGTRPELLDLLGPGHRSVADLAATAGLGWLPDGRLQTPRRGGPVTGEEVGRDELPRRGRAGEVSAA